MSKIAKKTATAAKPAKVTRKASAPLTSSLVVSKDAPAAATLTAPPPPPAPAAVEPPARKGRGPNKQPVEDTESMGFRVPKAWAHEFRRYSFDRGTKYHETLIAAFEALKEKEAL